MCLQLAQGCTLQRGGWDSNSRPADHRSSAVPLRHRATEELASNTWPISLMCHHWQTFEHCKPFTYFVKHPCNSWEHYKNVNQDTTLRITLTCTITSNNTLWFKKNAQTLADYNYDSVQAILIIFSMLFANDHKSCLMVKFSTSPHTWCHYTLWHTMLYFALITLLIAKNAPTSDHHNFNKR